MKLKPFVASCCIALFCASVSFAQPEEGQEGREGGDLSGRIADAPDGEPTRGQASEGKKALGRAFLAGDYIYLKMPQAVETALRSFGEDAPEVTGTINGVEVGQLQNMIKTMHDVITVVSGEGVIGEALMG
ncbi:hypothetical protein ACFL2T_07365, partial [Elusimicrobiota bacterium]